MNDESDFEEEDDADEEEDDAKEAFTFFVNDELELELDVESDAME